MNETTDGVGKESGVEFSSDVAAQKKCGLDDMQLCMHCNSMVPMRSWPKHAVFCVALSIVPVDCLAKLPDMQVKPKYNHSFIFV